MESFKEWAIAQHRDTNHKYGDNLPYEFHLMLAHNVAEQFRDLQEAHFSNWYWQNISDAVWGHDLLEDCRVTYNDLITNGASKETANIIYAVTNEKGKNRKERANDKYYQGIRETNGAVFVKLCDRIANVRYSKLVGGKMLEMYRKENPEFVKALGCNALDPLLPMFLELENLLKP